MSNAIQPVPHSAMTEANLLGQLMIKNNVIHEVIGILTPEMFYGHKYRTIYQGIVDLADKHEPFDAVSLQEHLCAEEDSGFTLAEIGQMAKDTIFTEKPEAHARIIRDHYIRRQVIAGCNNVIEIAQMAPYAPVDELMQVYQGVGIAGANVVSKSAPVAIKEVMKMAIEQLEERYEADGKIIGLSTGLTDLDDVTNGMCPGDLIVIAARPSMGKTALALNVAASAAKEGAHTLFISLETNSVSLVNRMLAAAGPVDYGRLNRGNIEEDEWPHISRACTEVAELPFHLDDQFVSNPNEIRAKGIQINEAHNLGLIVVDYIQLIAGSSGENRVNELANISRGLKLLAKELQIPIIVLSQLNRGLELRPNKRPVMSDLRDSGAIEQDADKIIGIYRDELYNEQSPDKGVAELLVLKNRDGERRTVRVAFQGEHQRFTDLIEGDYASQSGNTYDL